MSTKKASLKDLTAKDCSVRPWRSRFNLVSQSLTTFRMWWSCCQGCEFCSWMFQGCRNERFQRVCGRRSHRASHVCNVSQWAAFICCETKSRQITENPAPRRRPCQQRKLVDVIGIHRWSGGLMSKTAYKRRHMKSSSIATHLYVNKKGITQRPHCQRLFCPPLKISFQSGVSMFDNISGVMILLSNPSARPQNYGLICLQEPWNYALGILPTGHGFPIRLPTRRYDLAPPIVCDQM